MKLEIIHIETHVNYSLYNKKTIKNSNFFEKIVKNDEKVLEIMFDLLYNKHRDVFLTLM